MRFSRVTKVGVFCVLLGLLLITVGYILFFFKSYPRLPFPYYPHRNLGVALTILGCGMVSSMAGVFLYSMVPKELEQPQRTLPTIREASPVVVPRRLWASLGVFSMFFGSILLIFLGWLTWHDVTVWGKDVALIFFGSRSGEAISLGIGFKAIYYFLIGLGLLFSGVLTFFRTRVRASVFAPNSKPLT